MAAARRCAGGDPALVALVLVSAVKEGSYDLQVYTAQIYNLFSPVMPGDFPIAPADPSRPVRLYYPRDDGSALRKESLAHTAAIVAGLSLRPRSAGDDAPRHRLATRALLLPLHRRQLRRRRRTVAELGAAYAHSPVVGVRAAKNRPTWGPSRRTRN